MNSHEATTRHLWDLREVSALGAAMVSWTLGPEIHLVMAGSARTQQTAAPLLRSCVLAETCNHRPGMPGTEILCLGCGTGKKLKTVALKAGCKNSLSLECKGDLSVALGSPVQCQYWFVWRAGLSTRAGLYSPLYENMSAIVQRSQFQGLHLPGCLTRSYSCILIWITSSLLCAAALFILSSFFHELALFINACLLVAHSKLRAGKTSFNVQPTVKRYRPSQSVLL